MLSSKYIQTLVPQTLPTAEMSLAELIDIALQNNPSTKQTWALARASAAQYGESLSAFYPNVEFSGFFFRERAGFPQSGIPTVAAGAPTTIDESVTSGVTTTYFTETGPDVILSYTLFDFGQRTAASIAAREALYYADLNHNFQIQTVLKTVMDDYYDYLYQMSVQKADEANLANAQMALDAANEKFDLGLAALGDVAQERTQFLQSKINLTSQKLKVEQAFAQLAADLGLPANVPFKVQFMPDQVSADPILDNLDSLVALAQENRQDFLAVQSDLRSKEATLLQVKRSMLPVITTQLSTGRYWFNKNQHELVNHWTGVLGVSFPIFDGYLIRNQMKNAQAQVDYSKAKLMESELSVIQQVTVARVGVKTAAANLNDSDEYLKAAELEFKIALSSYKQGVKTILDVLQAQSSLADARSKKAEAQKNWFFSLANMAYVTGSLSAIPNEDA